MKKALRVIKAKVTSWQIETNKSTIRKNSNANIIAALL